MSALLLILLLVGLIGLYIKMEIDASRSREESLNQKELFESDGLDDKRQRHKDQE